MKAGDKIKFKNDKHLKDVYEITRIGDDGFGFKGKNEWGYCNFDAKEFEIVKEDEEMKELTFKEVIANIKEGEAWESEYKKIYCNEAGIIIEEKSDTNGNDMYFANARIYKLVRQEYSFQEAFEALEDGEEIESVESKWRWKKDTDKTIWLLTPHGGGTPEHPCRRIFSIDEIKGKWYINK